MPSLRLTIYTNLHLQVDITTQYDCLVTADQCGANGTLGEACYNDVECAEPAVKFLVKRMTVAPNFEEKGKRPWLWTVNDIALIELEEDVRFTNFIRPVCLPHELAPKPFEYRMVLKGWGNEIPGLNRPSSSTVLQELSDLVETPLFVPAYPSHTQSVERQVKQTTRASAAVAGYSARDGCIRSSAAARKLLPKFESKKDFQNNFV